MKIPDDISDWDSIDFPEMGTVRELRVYGFRELNSGKTLDLRSSDPIVFKTVEGCLRGGFPLRPAFSDIGVSTTADLGIDHLGILQITTREEKVIIGVSETKFYLGTWHGSNRQAFYSWGLAKQVDDLLFEATGKHLEKKHFEALSGEEIIRENKRLYEGIRAASRDQSSKGGAQPPEHAPED
ncbi:MAG: hypothetical protein A2V70_11425 [Planctomycetes bacterium RBG_13_63_9]|nr:MAG: hypothetical protein A2V70_11425 [Planctomycetes bacterium RBG_13_63_9]